VLGSGSCGRWSGDLDGVGLPIQSGGDDLDLPARHFSDIVAAFAFPTAVGVDGQAAVCVALNVVNVPDRRLTVRIPAFPVPPHDQLSKVTVEVAAMRISTSQRPADRQGVESAPPQPGLAGGQDVAG
jgi:hypothetical protein